MTNNVNMPKGNVSAPEDAALLMKDESTGLQPELLTSVSALFTSRDSVDRVVAMLTDAGMPRDLIEVVVAPAAAAQFYSGVARAPRRQTLQFAGIGALAGLIIGVVISLVMISLPSFASAGPAALVQLLGPNVMTVGGAALGALIGYFVPRHPAARHFRAGQSPDTILVVARVQSPGQVPAVLDLLSGAGGHAAGVQR